MSPDPQNTELRGVTVRRVQALRGPSLYAYMPVLKVELDIGPYEERPSDTFPGFVERLTAALPGLQEHGCSLGRPGGFVERLRRGTYLAHITEHVTLELQAMMGFDVSFGKARGTGETGVYRVVIEYEEEEPARAAFDVALRLVLASMHGDAFDFEAELERLQELADDHRLGPSTAAIVDAARRRGIPVRRLLPKSSLIQFGHGVHQKRIRASQTSFTSSIAVELCQEKPVTNQLLRDIGLPVPEGERVSSADEAWKVASELGLPVVLKPVDGNQGKGVLVNLQSEEEVRKAYDVAAEYGDVMVEQHIPGDDYRLLVVNGRLVAAARRCPAMVKGDGRRTVRELVEETNKDPRRRPGHSSALTRIRLDDAANLVLQQQGLTVDSVPEEGQVVKLRQNANLSTGGTATDVTDEVHPSVARVAELAAKTVGLDVAGVDLVCLDIRRPLAEQRGAIVEVNAAPGLRMHIQPAEGTPRDVGTPIVEMLYPNGAPARIPIISITGTNGKTTVTRLVSEMFETAGKVVGMTCTDGIYVDRERVEAGDCSGPHSAGIVLNHPRVEVAVLETARGGILRKGLGFDRCSVGVVTNISPDHIGQGGIDTVEELARVKRVVIESVARDGTAVLNADDPLVAEMRSAHDGKKVYFSVEPVNNPLVREHLARGGTCVLAEDGRIVIATGTRRSPVVELERVPFTHGGRFGFQVQNALAATAAAWASGLSVSVIAETLTRFDTNTSLVPGRFNMMELFGREIIVDYGHNSGAMHAMGQAVGSLELRRTLMVLGLPGDRRNEELVATALAAVPFVDEFVLYDLADLRERAPGEVPRLLGSELPHETPREYATNEKEALLAALKTSRPGDRIILISDIVDQTLEMIELLQWTEPSATQPAEDEAGARPV